MNTSGNCGDSSVARLWGLLPSFPAKDKVPLGSTAKEERPFQSTLRNAHHPKNTSLRGDLHGRALGKFSVKHTLKLSQIIN